MLKESLKNIPIRDLHDNGKLSVRALNCCLYIDLYTLYDIITYYEEGGSFMEIRNVGHRTSLELETLCKDILFQLKEPQIGDHQKKEPEYDRKSEVKELIENDLHHALNDKLISPAELFNYLSPLKKILVEKKYNELVSSCSKRTARWLGKINFENFIYDYLIERDGVLMNIRNLGKKAYPELIALKRKFENELLNIILLPEDAFPRERLILEKGKWFEEDFVYDYYTQQGHIPMFWILEKELRSNDRREIDVLLHSYHILENNKLLTNNSLGKIHNLSSQRINQIKNKTYRNFFSPNNSFIKQMKEECSFYQHSIKEDDIIWQDDDRISALIERENIHFTRAFILKILSLFTDSTHIYMGSFAIRENDKTWKNSVLIPAGLAESFNFNRFITDINHLVSISRIDLISHLGVYLLSSPGWQKYKDGILEGVIKVASDILEHEFGLATVSGKVITPPPPVLPKQPSDVIYEILKQQGTPMHIDDIFTEFKKILPEHKYTSSKQLRPLLYQHDLITHKGRKSMYMLKEWKHIKSGTIRETIIEFLNAHDSPRAVGEITDHVLQYFPETNINSIRTSMIKDSKKRFKQYKNGCFGLSNKTYPDKTGDPATLGISNKPFDERLADLEKFISQNWHFPFSASTDQNETSLYRWWRLQCINFDQLTEGQKSEVERIKDQYADIDTEKKVYEWNSKYNMLINFLSDNQRMPSSGSIGLEKMLYDWYSRAKNDFKTNRLNDEQKKKYLKFEKLAKNPYSFTSTILNGRISK